MIRVEGLTILFRTFGIRDLDITIEEGQFHFLLGPTGSGKTLILESIAGLYKPRKGKIWIEGREVQALPPEQREIGYVPQDLALFPHLRVMDNILYGIRARNLPLGDFEAHVNRLIEVMRVGSLLDRYPAGLSGGEKQRVALIRALASRPRLLLLDEPLSGLDPSIKAEIQQLMKALHAAFRPTTLCVTHNFEEARFLADAITVCMDGKVEQSGVREDVFKRPRTEKVAQFLGARNLFRGCVQRVDETARSYLFETGGVRMSVPVGASRDRLAPGEEAVLLVRPERVVVLSGGDPAGLENLIPVCVVEWVDMGKYRLVYLDWNGSEVPLEVVFSSCAGYDPGLVPGMEARVSFREDAFWLMKTDQGTEI
jgi:ABC-type Fe3+/spermidine/putrescine transport system ATPase subunit